MMPTCNNCGSHVTKKYVKVFSDGGGVDGCPNCPDMVRNGADVHKNRSKK
jgi:hypothetical protein